MTLNGPGRQEQNKQTKTNKKRTELLVAGEATKAIYYTLTYSWGEPSVGLASESARQKETLISASVVPLRAHAQAVIHRIYSVMTSLVKTSSHLSWRIVIVKIIKSLMKPEEISFLIS